MSRLLAAALGALALAGCSPEAPKATPPAGRFDAVRATEDPGAPEKWCDAWFGADAAPRLELPPVAAARSGTLPTPPADRWVLVNVWATWCAPCRREMPLLLNWRQRLAREGRPLDIWFLSVDERPDDLARALAEHDDLAPGVSLRLANPGGLEAWLRKYQKDPVTTIPLQILAGPGGKVRCIRAGALGDGDYPELRSVLR